MNVKKFITNGDSQTNTYVVNCSRTGEGFAIDPGAGCEEVLQYIEEKKIDLRYIINTHSHPDHCGGNSDLCNQFNAKLIINDRERKRLKGLINLNYIPPFLCEDASFFYGESVSLGDLNFVVLKTPGHTEGSISIMVEEAIFIGDLLIYNTSNQSGIFMNKETQKTISEKIIPLENSELIFYPGHGQAFTLKQLKGVIQDGKTV